MRRGIAASVVTIALVLGGAPDAGAHAILVRSSPASRAALHQPPDRVSLWFNERLEQAYSTVTVWTAREAQVDLRDVAVDAAEPRLLAVSLPRLAPGAYVVRYRVLSVDGHVVEGRFTFTVAPP